MTKYILHGGNTSKKSAKNRRFFHEILKGTSNPVNLLLVYFAKDSEKWPKLIEQDKGKFIQANPEKKINFSLAREIILKNQIKTADVIYLRGGDSLKLKEALSKIKNLKKEFKGKTIAGDSAGAYVLAKHYYSNDHNKILDGFNLIPIKVTAHYSAKKKDKLELLKKHGKKLKTHALKEEEFIIVKEK